MPAREEAREAGYATTRGRIPPWDDENIGEAIDAASDKWEPYVQAIGLAAAVSFDDVKGMRFALMTIQSLCEEALQ